MTTITLTAYCACIICTPGLGITATGVKPIQGITVARNGVKLNTPVTIPGIGQRIVQDRMHRRYNKNHIDIYFNKHEDAKKFGIKIVRIK